MATWNETLPSAPVDGASGHITDHTRIRAVLVEIRTNVDALPTSSDVTSTVNTAVATGKLVPINAQTANYTLVAADAGKAVEITSASTVTVTVPPNSSVAFPVGTIIEVARLGAGAVNIAAGSGVTVNSAGSLLGLRAQYSAVSLRKRATDTWLLVGDLA